MEYFPQVTAQIHQIEYSRCSGNVYKILLFRVPLEYFRDFIPSPHSSSSSLKWKQPSKSTVTKESTLLYIFNETFCLINFCVEAFFSKLKCN